MSAKKPSLASLQQAAEIAATPDKLEKIKQLAVEMKIRIGKVAAAAAVFETCTKELMEIKAKKLPDAMGDAGMKKFVLEDGTLFEIKPFYSTSIKEETQPEAFAWLRDNGHGGLIKNLLTIDVGQSDNIAEIIAEVKEVTEPLVLPLQHKESVHASTLKAFVKERAEAGDLPPVDLFNIFVGKIAEVAEPKKKF